MSEKPLTTDDLHRLPTDQDLTRLQRTTVLYYLHETNPDNGLVRDKTHPDTPCSIAAAGFGVGGHACVEGGRARVARSDPLSDQPSAFRGDVASPIDYYPGK